MLKFILFLKFSFMIFFFLNDKNFLFWKIQKSFYFFIFLFLLVNVNFLMFNLNNMMGMDLMSLIFIFLSVWICSLMILSSSMILNFNLYSNYYLWLIMFLLIFLIFTFCSVNLFMFYFWFESTLIPVIFMIFGWGNQPERIQAGLYLLFYTLFASLPLLFCLFFVFNSEDYLTLNFLFLNKNFFFMNFFFFFFFVFAFLVKLPIFMVHVWLPKAHVEAPVAGSMILAGVLLKLGGYGLIRVCFLILDYMLKFSYMFIVFSLMGGVMISLVCLRQIDMKSLVAYSSVAHMSFVISGIFLLYKLGWGFSFCLMIAHGLCSSGLFFLVNVCYERMNSRSLMINKGLMVFMPNLTFWWFLFCIGNMAAPTTLNLMGEIGLLMGILSWSKFLIILLLFLSFFSACYSLYLFSYSQHGKYNFSNYSFFYGNVREYLVLFLHWFPMNFLFLKSDMMVLL
uniref:NADH dehydrogenase subunit 4 n=1 Tax=Stenochironomus tobaduodecimus TaxID=1636530 RepID=UPI001FAFAEFB|nr:NADH dehydrogenase subunit 4 [Stenochironomus tobaduodecimus]UKO33041.1 NADH dehydrogenase subunit 4 [Stenochironomus tobaduodecimus]